MSTTLDQSQNPPPPLLDQNQHDYVYHSRGSIGPVIGVLAVILFLCAIAVMIGRLCTGRRILGHIQYDLEGWIETKCASCIDGSIHSPPPRDNVRTDSVPLAASILTQETKKTEQNEQNPPGNVGS